MKICVVGNSNNLLGRGMGSFIDSCDVVIRMNNYQIEGFEEDVGTKEDIVIHAFEAEENVVREKVKLWLPTNYMDVNLLPPAKKLAELLVGMPSTLSESYLWEACGTKPSTGLVAIYMVREIYSSADVYLLGFGKPDEKYKHYYSEDWHDPVTDRHNWEREQKIIDDMVTRGLFKYA